jgi:hypothetical protein
MSHPLERVDDLAVQAFYFLGEHWFGPPSFTDEEEAALRSAPALALHPSGRALARTAQRSFVAPQDQDLYCVSVGRRTIKSINRCGEE